jgi:outer membrane protein, heavy metal efflux system
MLGVLFTASGVSNPVTGARSRTRSLRASGVTMGLSFGVFLLGCATTAGTSSYHTANANFGQVRAVRAVTAPPLANDSAIGLETASLDRAAYVRAVLERNPSIESTRQGFRAALSRVRQSGTFEDPMLDLGVAPLSIGTSRAPFGFEVGISQRLPWFGKRSLEASAAAAEANAVKSDFETMKRELALSAVILYDQYFIAARSIAINAQHVELMRAMQNGAIAQFQAGRGSAQDPLQAEAELAHMEHDTAILEAEREVTIARMNELLHRAPELPLPPPPVELPMPAMPSPSDAAELERDALAQRSEIAAARQRAQSARARADRANREYYPDVTVSTSYNSMWDTPEHRWLVGLGFNLPIQTGRRAGAAEEALALRLQFESEASRMTDAARTQVFVALKQLQGSEHVIGLFQKRLLPVARDQIDAARAGFTASQSPFMAVVEAEKNLRSVELDYEVARAECDRHRAELDRALGRMPGLDAPGDEP